MPSGMSLGGGAGVRVGSGTSTFPRISSIWEVSPTAWSSASAIASSDWPSSVTSSVRNEPKAPSSLIARIASIGSVVSMLAALSSI